MEEKTAQALPSTEKDIFLKELRSITSPAHKKLEEATLSKKIISENLSVNEYAAYLEKMLVVMNSFEKEIFPLLKPHFTDLDQRTKVALLEKDLNVLSQKVSLKKSDFSGFPSHHSVAYNMGAFYVLEGSILGGKFIYKNINATLGFDAEHGATYFNGYGAETGKLWSAFMEQFCSYALQSQNQKEIIQGADDTFKILNDLLNA